MFSYEEGHTRLYETPKEGHTRLYETPKEVSDFMHEFDTKQFPELIQRIKKK